MYQDANNLYGYPMTKKLPTRNFLWVKNISLIDEEFRTNYDKNGDIRFFLKVDVEYPEELHDLHIDLPFLPQKMKINGHNKLVCTHNEKKKNLKQALEHGLKLKKVINQLLFIKKHGLNHISR